MLAGAASGAWTWSIDPALGIEVAIGLLYALGSGRTVTPQRTSSEQRWRSACFYAGLITLAIALDSPIDTLAEKLFWVHMVQHTLLIVVAAPLIVLARPWARLWRALPLSSRRSLGRGLAQSPRASILRIVSRALGRPLSELRAVLRGVDRLAFPGAVRRHAALARAARARAQPVLLHRADVLEAGAVLPAAAFVSERTGALRVRGRRDDRHVVLAIVLALAPHPLYPAYAHEASRPGGISALADQHLAAGIMWVPGSVSFVVVIFVYINRWLSSERGNQRVSRLAGEH